MHRTNHLLINLLAATLVLSACGDDGGGSEEGSADTGQADTGVAPGGDTGVPSDTGTGQDTGSDDTGRVDTGSDDDTGTMADAAADTGPDTADCPLGHACNPIQIAQLPYQDSRDTTMATSMEFDGYSCAANTDESGPEYVYAVDIVSEGTLTASINEVGGDGIDVDVHILDQLSADACLARDNARATVRVQPGPHYIVIDTWVDGEGEAFPGPYTLDVTFRESTTGDCSMETEPLKMFWSSCDGTLDCFEAVDDADGQTYRWLQLPATGPVVKEAHLVTTEDDFGGSWPTSFTDQINAHYTRSEAVSGYSMTRSEPWAPAGEGGSEFGQGSTGAPVPVIDEAWYINMYWRHRPAKGTRMIVQNPENGRSVVASAGYETGPGANTAVAGVAEEIHHYLGTSHRDHLLVGFAENQNLPLGPIECP